MEKPRRSEPADDGAAVGDTGSADAAQAQTMRAEVQAWMMSPWGHAGIEMFSFAGNSIFLLFFAAGGGALGARLLARSPPARS